MIEVQDDDLVIFTKVTKSFQTPAASYTAIRDVTVSVKRGEIAILLGPSGCGKSTLLNLTAGLLTPTQGQVLYDGRPVAGLNPKVAYMTQQDHLLPWRTVEGNVAVPLELAARDRAARDERVTELLALVGLKDFANSYLISCRAGCASGVRSQGCSQQIARLCSLTSPLAPSTPNCD